LDDLDTQDLDPRRHCMLPSGGFAPSGAAC
jgi:hypothetical protein